MSAIQLLLLSVLVSGVGAGMCLLLNPYERAARWTTGLAGVTAAGMALAAAAQAMLRQPAAWQVPDPLGFGSLTLEMDGLASVMVALIALVALAASVYSIAYLKHAAHRSLGVLGFFFNLFVALMLLVVTVANAFYFLILWEMMTLASYFLVIFEAEKKESIQAGYLYMLVAHAGTALIMLGFFGFYLNAGSFDFAAFRQAQLSPSVRNIVFLLGFLGFGAKAGIVPLHIWLPRAHPAAPSPVSALLSAVMVKTAIYGILRVCVDLLGTAQLWWGLLALGVGALSAVLGVFYALSERDVKRILAYSSVENIGIILLGIGTGMIGSAAGQPAVALLGFLAALYHMLSHAFFKGLLFLGAGVLDFELHTRNLNEMGGLGRRMPWTALAFLVGAMSVAALPPFTGFVSEWFTYQALLAAARDSAFVVRAALPLCAVLLALTGAMAAMVAVKMYGSAFLGPARSSRASSANEAPGAMLTGMLLLAAGCVGLGLGAPLVVPYLAGAAAGAFHLPILAVAEGLQVYPGDMATAVLSPPLTALLLLGLLALPALLVAAYAGYKAGRRVVPDPWSCGYAYSTEMSVTASNFDQPITATFSPIYQLRSATGRPLAAMAHWARTIAAWIARAEPILERAIRGPTTRAVGFVGQRLQALQMGDLRMYCLYIILTLVILLVVTVR